MKSARLKEEVFLITRLRSLFFFGKKKKRVHNVCFHPKEIFFVNICSLAQKFECSQEFDLKTGQICLLTLWLYTRPEQLEQEPLGRQSYWRHSWATTLVQQKTCGYGWSVDWGQWRSSVKQYSLWKGLSGQSALAIDKPGKSSSDSPKGFALLYCILHLVCIKLYIILFF